MKSEPNRLRSFVLWGPSASVDFVGNVARLRRRQAAFRRAQATRSPVRSGSRLDREKLIQAPFARTFEGNVAELRLAEVPGGSVAAWRASDARDRVLRVAGVHFLGMRAPHRSVPHLPAMNVEKVWAFRRGRDHLRGAGSHEPIEPIAPGPQLRPILRRCLAAAFANSQLDPSERVRSLRATSGSTPEGTGMPMFCCASGPVLQSSRTFRRHWCRAEGLRITESKYSSSVPLGIVRAAIKRIVIRRFKESLKTEGRI